MITEKTNLKARAFKSNFTSSDVKSAEYSFRIIYVNYLAPLNSNEDGSSWQNAKRTIQAGIGAAEAGYQVWVARGTYNGNIIIDKDIKLYGGFIGTEYQHNARDYINNITVINGNNNGSVIKVEPGITASTVIDGFTIQNGGGTVVDPFRYGGGIYCYQSSPIIENNKITGNTATNGGGIYCRYSSAKINNNEISSNSATTNSGGLCLVECESVNITNNIIKDNSTNGAGGAMNCYLGNGTFTISNNLIKGNSGTSGGIRLHGVQANITNNTIMNNTGSYAGGIYCSDTASNIKNNIVALNTCQIEVVCEGTPIPALYKNCVFHDSEDDGYSDEYFPTSINHSNDLHNNPDINLSFELNSTSPCINAGDNNAQGITSYDLNGNNRIIGETIDIGAYEYQTP